jgi:hypothetical protein
MHGQNQYLGHEVQQEVQQDGADDAHTVDVPEVDLTAEEQQETEGQSDHDGTSQVR